MDKVNGEGYDTETVKMSVGACPLLAFYSLEPKSQHRAFVGMELENHHPASTADLFCPENDRRVT